MKQVLRWRGQAIVEEVPAPRVEAGTVLVRVDTSCVSAGTELSNLRAGGKALWKRALQRPDLAKKLLRMLSSRGLARSGAFLRHQVASLRPLGYSAAGTVVDVGPQTESLQRGQRVACAGNQCAFHAEWIAAPKNLVVPVPDGVSLPHASTVALGAIAVQGVRRANPTLGETFVVLGLGSIGQLVAQIVRANGCRVLGSDLDRRRIHLAKQLGMHFSVDPPGRGDIQQVMRLTGGVGADGVIIAATTHSNSVISSAFGMCRRKGRVVLVGDVGLKLNRADMYEKELDFLISTSYGAGRYDPNYEQLGLDYPLAHVRWTENRNMAEYLRLVQEGIVRLDPLISKVFSVEQAASAYANLKDRKKRSLIVLLEYPGPAEPPESVRRSVVNPSAHSTAGRRIRIAVVGPGSFARNTHLPNLRALGAQYQIEAIVGRTGHSAISVAKQYGARLATTDYEAVLGDRGVDAVLIATRHDHHAEMAMKALRAGKHVLVEKPLALTQTQLDQIQQWYSSRNGDGLAPVLMVGFNRRFSPFVNEIHEQAKNRNAPMVIQYLINADDLPADHWVRGHEGGGRNLSEACHAYDLFTFLTGSKLHHIHVTQMNPAPEDCRRGDNFVATMKFADGSLATLTYSALGSPDYPKEQMQLLADGTVFLLDDYRKLKVFGAQRTQVRRRIQDKGHRAQLEAFAESIRHGAAWPIPLWQQIQATQIALDVQRSLRGAN